MHLWFLWMLLWFCVLAAPVLWLGKRLPPRGASAVGQVLGRLGGAPWGVAVLAAPLALVGAMYPQGVVVPDLGRKLPGRSPNAFAPPPPGLCRSHRLVDVPYRRRDAELVVGFDASDKVRCRPQYPTSPLD